MKPAKDTEFLPPALPLPPVATRECLVKGAVTRVGASCRREAGFALLLVYLMAAMIAIAMYMELPRVAMESERNKEQLLIERGEQYKRAIQIFVRKNGRYPAKIEDLEDTNNVRYLRRRYIDPMTGKDDWRIIHCGPGGILTDSVNQKPATTKTDQSKQQPNTYVGELPTAGSDTDTGAGSTSPALRRRPSDMPGFGPSDQASMAGGQAVPNPDDTGANPPDSSAAPPAPGTIGQPGMPVQPGMIPGQGGPGGPGSIIPVTINPQAGAANLGTGQPVDPTTGMPVSGLPGSYPQQPGGAAQSDAARLIQRILTSPRPGGAPAGVGAPGASGSQTIGGGIAGVASKSEQQSIMVYDQHQKFNEWEFIYDRSKDRTNAGVGAKPTPGAPANQGPMPGSPGMNPTPSQNPVQQP